jgi:hypothetical protein
MSFMASQHHESVRTIANAEVGICAGLGYLIGRYRASHNSTMAEKVEQNVISDYTNDANV